MTPVNDNQFASAPELMTVSTNVPDVKNGLKIKGPVIDPSKAKFGGFDVQAEINKMAASAKSDDGLRRGEILPDDALRGIDTLIDVDIALLQQAKTHIQNKDYPECFSKNRNLSVQETRPIRKPCTSKHYAF